MSLKEETNFVKELKECVQEYRKQLNETATDEDAARFYNKKLAGWIFDHMKEIDMLSTIGLNKSFVIFVKHYLFDGE